MPRPNLYYEIVELIARRLEDDREFVPSSIASLAHEHGVSYGTMWKVIDELERRNLLTRWKGRRISRTDRPIGSTPRFVSGGPAARVYEQLKKRILDAVYRAGVALPKYEYLLRSEKVASRTLRAVLRALNKENLIHKDGKQWVVGPFAPQSSVGMNVHTLVRQVIVLTNDDLAAYSLFNATFFGSFIQNLNTELQHHGIQITLVHREAPSSTASLLTWGESGAQQKIALWGERYQGALVVDTTPELSIHRAWAPILSVNGKRPVVFFDYTNAGAALSRESLRLPKMFFRLISDEERSVELALRYLHASGHRIIGSPTVDRHGYDWTVHRHMLIRTVAARMDPSVHIVSTINAEPFWDLGGICNEIDRILNFREALHEHCLKSIGGRKRTSPHSTARMILQRTPSMARMLDRGVTAIVAPNDRLAHAYYLWCKDAGIEIPRGLSLVGFDNLPESVGFPVASIDFGFARLGYLAAHILIGDIPVNENHEGVIAGIPTLIDSGSVERPAKQNPLVPR